MSHFENPPCRRSPRLALYDYREPGIYFVTICTDARRCIFGDVVNDAVTLSDVGEVAREQWWRTLDLRPYVDHDAFVVMPNHVHLLFGLWTAADEAERYETAGAVPIRRDTMHGVPPVGEGDELFAEQRFQNHGARSVSAIVGTYKAAVTRVARRRGLWSGGPLWQGRYHDRIVRSQPEHAARRAYIEDNPRRWHQDRFHPEGRHTWSPQEWHHATGGTPAPGPNRT